MIQPRFSFVPVMGHELHVTEWGNSRNKPLVMWHGLARTGRDFDELARALSDEYFVLCPDTIGRGLSSWSKFPEAEYSIAYYAGIATGLLDHYGIAQTSWIGTSMGGLIGMRMASGPVANRLSCLVINDIGPAIPDAAIKRILDYAASAPIFNSLADAEHWHRTAYIPFGPASDAFWARMARTSVRRLADGTFTTHYDPEIMVQFVASPAEMTSWDRFSRITLPVHLIQGKTSDILPDEIVDKMQTILPEMGTTVFQDCGHAPTLSRGADSEIIRKVLSMM